MEGCVIPEAPEFCTYSSIPLRQGWTPILRSWKGEAISGAAGVARAAHLILGNGVSEDRTSAVFGLRSPHIQYRCDVDLGAAMNHLYCAGRRAFYVSGNRHRPAVTTVHIDGTNAP